MTGHSFEDAVLMSKAVELGLPPSTGVIEFCNTAGKLGYVMNKVFNNSLVYNNVGCNERSSCFVSFCYFQNFVETCNDL